MGKVGRQRDAMWERVTLLEGGQRWKCNDCGGEFAGGASRIKAHLNKLKDKGIRPCTGKANSNTNTEHNLVHSQGEIQADDAEDQERTQDLQMMKRYVFECLRPEDKVIVSPLSYLTQEAFITLKPETSLDSVVIDTFVEILTDIERKKKTVPLNWYLPVTFSDAALKGKVSYFLNLVHGLKMKENYMSDLESCEKIFIPVHIGATPNGHFYLYIIHLKNKEVEIWDSLPNYTSEAEEKETREKLLIAMEKLFEKVTFTEFHRKMADDILLQPNGFDCGIFVINYMQQSDNYVKRDSSYQFDSQKEREDLALKLLNNDLNKEKQILFFKAWLLYNEVDEQQGHKRLRVDPSKEHFEDVGREMEVEYDDFGKRGNGHDDLEKGPPQSTSLKGQLKHSDRGFSLDGLIDHGKSHEVGQIQGDAKYEERIQVGSSSVSNRENDYLQVLQYVFECLSPTDKVYESGRLNLNQKEFITLKPRTFLDSLVIDVFVEILTESEKKKATPSNWYLPVMFSTAALVCDEHNFKDFVHRHKMRENYIFYQESPEKVFIPVHIGQKRHGHFYLYIFHLNKKVVEIWDSLPTFVAETDRDETTKKLFFAIEILFKQKKGAFSDYQTEMANDIRSQDNGFDCGVFVINYMQQSDNYVKRESSFQFDSQKEREDLALKLLNDDLNKEKQNLYDKARRHYAHVEKHDGKKRLRVDPSKERFEDVGREMEAEYDDGKQNKILQVERELPSLNHVLSSRHENGDNDVGSSSPTAVSLTRSESRLVGIEGFDEPGGQKEYDDSSEEEEEEEEEEEDDDDDDDFEEEDDFDEELEKDLIGWQFQRYTKQIRKWIEDDKVSAIGVWGMGGSGKTALASHIYDKLLEEGDIKVIWVTVSQNSIYNLQKVIARSIKLDIADEFEVKIIARKIFQAFKEMEKCVVILDDVWDHFFLKEVGFPMSDNRIKLILTTRIHEVCQGMGCDQNNKIEVGGLNMDESWALFKKTMGSFEGLSLGVKRIARKVAYECDGLPLAIVRIATSMKGKKQVGEWSHMLKCLKNLGHGQYEMDKWVFPVLRSSYDFLNNKLQRFFLYFALSTKGDLDDEEANHLIRRFVYESIDETKTLRAQYDENYNMLDRLKNHKMLDRCYDRWRMYKFLIVLAIGIAEDTSKIMANAYKKLTKIPSDNQWKDDLQKAFLTGNKIKAISNGTCLRCSQLSTLFLNGNVNLNYISDDFFKNMPALKILDLSWTRIKRLPESMSNLKCLTALLLSKCRQLSYIPSLSKLKQLISLDLWDTAITKAPMGLESLVNLRCLNLCYRYMSMSPSLISKLDNLDNLEIIVAYFWDISVFNTYVSLLDKHRVLTSYCLLLCSPSYISYYYGSIATEYSTKKILFADMDLRNRKAVLPGDIKELIIDCCQLGGTVGSCLCSVFSSYGHNNNNNPHQIERLDISSCTNVEYLCCFSGSCPFSHLTHLEIRYCDNMETLMTPRSLVLLQNLRTIHVQSCWEMKEIVGEDDHSKMELGGSGDLSHPTPITLPRLTSLELCLMPQLNSVYKGVMLCPSLQTFSAAWCKKLNIPWIEISNGCELPMEKTSTGYRWEIKTD